MSEAVSKKSGWTTVAFGDVVKKVTDKVDPEESGLERYVAGEHMDTDDLRIRRWGEIGDDYLGPAFHMRFKPGQVLYGSRRTYLRKVALADFEGITANTTYVLESKDPEILLPELLPFLMQAETFHEHSKRESKGSVNPYVNFSDLAWYKFALPPLEKQRRIAEVLQAVRASGETQFQLNDTLVQLTKSLIVQVEKSQTSKSVLLKDMCSIQNGFAFKSRDFVDSGIPLISIKTIQTGSIVLEKVTDFLPPQFEREYSDFVIRENDILMALSGATTGKSGIYESSEPAFLNQRVARFSNVMEDRVHPVYLRCLLGILEPTILRLASGSAQPNISTKEIGALSVSLPSMDDQSRIANAITQIEQLEKSIVGRNAQVRSLQRGMIDREFEDV